VGLLRVMHVEADMLDSIDDVRTGECQILWGTNEAPKLSQISNRRPILDRDHCLHVHGCRNWLAFHHAGVLKDVKSVLVLREEELIWSLLYGDSQEVMEGSEILHGELSLEGRYGVLQEHCAGCCKENVINIKQ
jgi:hypothetical protein